MTYTEMDGAVYVSSRTTAEMLISIAVMCCWLVSALVMSRTLDSFLPRRKNKLLRLGLLLVLTFSSAGQRQFL